MQVIFKNSWFSPAPEEQLFRKSKFPQEVPDKYRKHLPSTAKIVGKDDAVKGSSAPTPSILDQPAKEVIGQLGGMDKAELDALLKLELKDKNRVGVVNAIELELEKR